MPQFLDGKLDATGLKFGIVVSRFNSFGYSYVFDGASGRLDHGFATASLSGKVTDAVDWHINADEPAIIDYNLEYKQPACATCGPDYYTPTAYRSSDHDPMVMALSLLNTISGLGDFELIAFLVVHGEA